jgi:hypothetical protein
MALEKLQDLFGIGEGFHGSERGVLHEARGEECPDGVGIGLPIHGGGHGGARR